MRNPVFLGAAVAVLAACAATASAPTPRDERRAADDEAKIARALDGYTPGAPVSCVNQRLLRSNQTFGDGTILYRVSTRLMYRNDPPGGCGDMRSEPILQSRTTTGLLCSGDIIELIDRTSRTARGGCGLGQFVPYSR